MINILNRPLKLGFQAPKKRIIKRKFMTAEVDNFHYCISHDFWFDPEEQNRLLHYGKPCMDTDCGYREGRWNFYGNGHMCWNRRKGFHVDTLKRWVRKTRNLPVGTIVKLGHNYYGSTKKGTTYSLGYKYKIKKENKFDPKYEISCSSFYKNFDVDEKCKELVNLLRENGFIVSVKGTNPNFISSMISTAASYTGQAPTEVSDEGGQTAIAYGHGLRIGITEGYNSLYGYSDGCDNYLWDYYDEFNKWSQCILTSKTTSNEEFLKELLAAAAEKELERSKEKEEEINNKLS